MKNPAEPFERPPVEVLTPIAVCVLFGKSELAVRAAYNRGRIKTFMELQIGQQVMRLYSLKSALAFWGRDQCDKSELARMREFALKVPHDLLGSRHYCSVLSPFPFVLPGSMSMEERAVESGIY